MLKHQALLMVVFYFLFNFMLDFLAVHLIICRPSDFCEQPLLTEVILNINLAPFQRAGIILIHRVTPAWHG